VKFLLRERRLRELLASRALCGLSPADELELFGLRGDPGGEPDDYELAVAAIHLASSRASEPLPRGLRRRVEQSALENLGPNPECQ
jgi:hypothetical protein